MTPCKRARAGRRMGRCWVFAHRRTRARPLFPRPFPPCSIRRNPLIPAHNVLLAIGRAADRDAKHRQFLLRVQVRCKPPPD